MPIEWSSNNSSKYLTYKKIVDYLKQQKLKNPNYKVIDIGGAANPWAEEVVDVYVDLFDVQNKKVIIGNLFDKITWDKIEQERCDFCICSHTLEDIRSPDLILDNILKNFKEGFISFPNKHTELSLIDSQKILGYHHHRWIFTIKNGCLYICPKFPGVNDLVNIPQPCKKKFNFKNFFIKKTNDELQKNTSLVEWIDTSLVCKDLELAFCFKGSFPYNYVNGDYAGNNIEEMLNLYRIVLKEGI